MLRTILACRQPGPLRRARAHDPLRPTRPLVLLLVAILALAGAACARTAQTAREVSDSTLEHLGIVDPKVMGVIQRGPYLQARLQLRTGEMDFLFPTRSCVAASCSPRRFSATPSSAPSDG